MKKIFMSAALASLMMVGCQNEMIEGQSNDNGDMFTLEVVQGGSRTALDGKQTVWSNDDKIFVTSEDGKVSGVLHYKGNNKFAGHVFGGKTTRLSHVIFPVPVDGKVKLNQPTGDRLDLPMIGAFGDDKSTVAMANACALVNLPVTGSDEISLSSANANTLTGHYEYKDGDFIFIPGTGNITIEVKDNKAFFAAATDVKGEPVDELELKVGTSEESIFIPVEEGKISESNVPEIEVNENGTMEDAVMNVTTPAILEMALNQYAEVKLAGDIEIGENGITIAEGKEVTLDLNGFVLAGNINNGGTLTVINTEISLNKVSSFKVGGSSTLIQGGTYNYSVNPANGFNTYMIEEGLYIVLPEGSAIVANNDELNKAAKEGVNSIYIKQSGDYDLKGVMKNGRKFVGLVENLRIANTTNFASSGNLGDIRYSIHLENVIVTNTVAVKGDGTNATFTNVVFEKGMRQNYGRYNKFENCTFGSNDEGYAAHWQSEGSYSEGQTIVLKDCDFCGGIVALGGSRRYYFENCEFDKNTAFYAYENVTLKNCTVEGEKVTDENKENLFGDWYLKTGYNVAFE